MKAKGSYELVPAGLYPAIVQAGVILKASGKKKTAQRFMDFLRTPAIVDLMKQYGFENPKANAAREERQ